MIPIVILCGGFGLRMGSIFPNQHKALIPILHIPILNRVMHCYTSQGYNHFYLCLGYEGEQILKNFTNQEDDLHQFKKERELQIEYNDTYLGKCKIRMIDTGIETSTAGRLLKIRNYLELYDNFFLTYSDGISDVALDKLAQQHTSSNVVATITGVRPHLSYGVLNIDGNIALSFNEKPLANFWINGGFCIMSKDIFIHLNINDDLGHDTFKNLSKEKLLGVYKHHGFWKCLDTPKDYLELENIYHSL